MAPASIFQWKFLRRDFFFYVLAKIPASSKGQLVHFFCLDEQVGVGRCDLLGSFDCESSFSHKRHPTCRWCGISQWADLAEPCLAVPPWIQVPDGVNSSGKICEGWTLAFLVSCHITSSWLWAIVLFRHVFCCTTCTVLVDEIFVFVPMIFCVLDVPAVDLLSLQQWSPIQKNRVSVSGSSSDFPSVQQFAEIFSLGLLA